MKFSALVASALVASAAAADYIMWNAPSVSFDDPALWANPDGKFSPRRERMPEKRKREEKRKKSLYDEKRRMYSLDCGAIGGVWFYRRLLPFMHVLWLSRRIYGGTANTFFLGRKLLSRGFSPEGKQKHMPTYYIFRACGLSISVSVCTSKQNSFLRCLKRTRHVSQSTRKYFVRKVFSSLFSLPPLLFLKRHQREPLWRRSGQRCLRLGFFRSTRPGALCERSSRQDPHRRFEDHPQRHDKARPRRWQFKKVHHQARRQPTWR